jgi:hypothetical protein
MRARPRVTRANFLWGAPRIHGELLKLGITVSQATVSRYMPTSRKDRRSQAWRTFIRNRAITIVQSHSFNGHNWARDLLSQVRSRLRVFVYHLSTSVVAPAAGPSGWAVWHMVHRLLGAVARPRVWSTRIITLTTNSTAMACRYQLSTRKVGTLTIDLIRASPTPTRAETSLDRSSTRSTRERASLPVQLNDVVPRPRQIARILEVPLAHRIATAGQPPDPIFGTPFSRSLGVLTF